MQPTGPYKRLARQAREVALRATPSELRELERLHRLVRCDEVCVFEAQDILRAVIRGQLERQAA